MLRATAWGSRRCPNEFMEKKVDVMKHNVKGAIQVLLRIVGTFMMQSRSEVCRHSESQDDNVEIRNTDGIVGPISIEKYTYLHCRYELGFALKST